jgi:Ran GTPase-activating protein (RanGAP) involved in mRNA processing and transport
LNLSRNKLGKEGAKIIGKLMNQNGKIEALDLSFNKIGNAGAEALSKSLMDDSTLKYLNLYGNIIDVVGTSHLAEFVGKSKTLQLLDIGYNRIRDKGLNAITTAMTNNKQCAIETLGLKYNFLSEDAIINMFKCFMGENSKVRELYIKNNNVNDFGLKNIKAFYDS